MPFRRLHEMARGGYQLCSPNPFHRARVGRWMLAGRRPAGERARNAMADEAGTGIGADVVAAWERGAIDVPVNSARHYMGQRNRPNLGSAYDPPSFTETDVAGTLRVTRAVFPRMSHQRAATVSGISRAQSGDGWDATCRAIAVVSLPCLPGLRPLPSIRSGTRPKTQGPPARQGRENHPRRRDAVGSIIDRVTTDEGASYFKAADYSPDCTGLALANAEVGGSTPVFFALHQEMRHSVRICLMGIAIVPIWFLSQC